MKKFLFTLLIIVLFHNNSEANHHFPILRDSKAAIEQGKILYNQNCASCHQANLSGAKGWNTTLDEDGQRLAPPLNGTAHTWHHPDEMLHNVIKYGYANIIKNYKGKMLGFGDTLTDQNIDHILAYIKSTWNDEVYQHQIAISSPKK